MPDRRLEAPRAPQRGKGARGSHQAKEEAVLMKELAIALSIVIAAVIVAFAFRYESVFNKGGVL